MIQKGFKLGYNLMNSPFLENGALVCVLMAIGKSKVLMVFTQGFHHGVNTM